MGRKKKNKEEEVLRGYVLLVETMLINVFDKIRIKDSWHQKELSAKMLAKKKSDLKEMGDWLATDNCKTWFNILGQCTGRGSLGMYRTFLKTHKKSTSFINNEFRKARIAVDKLTIDNCRDRE
jgi:hypothetical protein